MKFADLALRLLGATSGEQIIKTAAAASGAITLPAGTVDFSATGGAGQVVQQTTAGGAFTVGAVSTVIGTTTNDNAAAGYVGEYVSSQILFTSAVNIPTSATNINVTSISLTAGDWDVWGNVVASPGATTTFTDFRGSISTTSGAPPDFSLIATVQASFTASNNPGMAVPPQRLSLGTTTTVYLIARVVFATSTMAVAGSLQARRRR
jgi:hypothetical protein